MLRRTATFDEVKEKPYTKGTKRTKNPVPVALSVFLLSLVEMIGFEPTASAVQVRRSPN